MHPVCYIRYPSSRCTRNCDCGTQRFPPASDPAQPHCRVLRQKPRPRHSSATGTVARCYLLENTAVRAGRGGGCSPGRRRRCLSRHHSDRRATRQPRCPAEPRATTRVPPPTPDSDAEARLKLRNTSRHRLRKGPARPRLIEGDPTTA